MACATASLPQPHGVICGLATHPDYFGRLKGIIFDCDGVIFDSKHANARYYNAVLERLGLPPMTGAQTSFVHAHTVSQSLEHIVPQQRRADLKQAMAQVSYTREILPLLRPEPGFYELILWLRQKGIRLAIATNRSDTMDNVAHRFGLRPFFFPIMTSLNAAAKPHPEPVYAILQAWSAAKDEVAYVGDSIIDQRTAEAAGVRLIAYKNPRLQATLHARDFWTLRQALTRKLG